MRLKSNKLQLCIFLISMGALAYEILLIRILAIIHTQNIAAVVISLALLGYGYSGTFLYFIKSRIKNENLSFLLFLNSICFAFSCVFCFLLVEEIPYYPQKTIWEISQLINFFIYFFILSIPFFFASNCIGLALYSAREQAANIYFMDLLGAGFGALLIVGLMLFIPVRLCVFLLAAVGFFAAISASNFSLLVKVYLAAITVFLSAVGLFSISASLKHSEYKSISKTLLIPGAKVLSEHQGVSSFLSALSFDQVPLRYAPGLSPFFSGVLPDQFGIFTDGESLSPWDVSDSKYYESIPEALPYMMSKQDQILIVGLDNNINLSQKLQPFAKVKVIEEDYGKVNLIKNTLQIDYRVAIINATPRAYFASSNDLFDIVHISGVSAFGDFSRQKKSLLTRESIRLIRRNLEDSGILLVSHWLKNPHRTAPRIWLTLLESFDLDQIMLVQSLQTAVFLAKNSNFTPEELAFQESFCKKLGFSVIYSPKNGFQGNLGKILSKLKSSDFIRDYPFSVLPVNDNRPYFQHFSKIKNYFQWLRDAKVNRHMLDVDYINLWLALFVGLVSSILLILSPLFAFRRVNIDFGFVLYFLSIGFGFMVIELSFLHWLEHLLGSSTLAVSVALASFLIFAGLGAMRADYFQIKSIIGVVVFSFFGLLIVDMYSLSLLSSSLSVRTALLVLLISPMAFFMGQPLVIGLKLYTKAAPGLIPWAWGINACSSVVGALMGTLANLNFGFIASIFIGIIFYSAAGVLLLFKRRGFGPLS